MILNDTEFDFYFIRHGESETNVTPGVAAGANFDAPMTERGHRQAEVLGRRLAHEGVVFDRIYSSTMVRAVQTTEGMLKGMGKPDTDFERVEAIMERQVPSWRGRPKSEVWTPETTLASATRGKWFQPGNGESARFVQRRFSNWLEDEFMFNPAWNSAEGRQTIAIVSHGDALRFMFHFIMGFDDRLIFNLRIGNCSISRFRFSSDAWSILSINDSHHTFDLGDVIQETDSTNISA